MEVDRESWPEKLKQLVPESELRGKIKREVLRLNENDRSLLFDDDDDAVRSTLISLIPAPGSVLPKFVPLILEEKHKQQLEEYIKGRICLPRYTKNGVDLPCYCKRPSLLLHGLAEQDTKIFDDFIRKSTRFVLVCGTSGAGKTRTLYSHLAKNFGLFFVCSDLGNGGSADLRSMIARIKPYMGDDPSKNANVVIFAVTLLLLARLQIFFYCKSKNVTPEGWLLLQAACQHLDKDGDPVDLDIFSAHYANLLEQNIGVFSLPQVELMIEIDRARKALVDLAADDDLPFIVVDEAQLICAHDPVHGTFEADMPDASTGIREKRPLAKPILEALYNAKRSSQHHVVFAGTGYTLYFRRNELSSALAKPISDDDQYTGFVGWKSPEDMVAYARGILNVDECVESIIKDHIFPWFRGRFRPFATLLEEVVIRGDDIGSLWKKVMEGLTTDKGLPGIQKSFYNQVRDFQKGKCTVRSKVEVVNVINVLLEATIQYFYYGRPFLAPTDLAATILEVGVGRTETGHSLVTIDEPLPLQAMYNYFLDSRQIEYALNERMNGINYSSSEGFYWQHVFPIEFEKTWKEKGVMANIDLFMETLSEDLENLKDQKSTILEGHNWDGKPPHQILLATKDYQSCEYLKDEKPRCKFFVCEDMAGCDIMWRVRFELGVIVLFTAQLKLRNSIGKCAATAMAKAAPVGGLIKLWKSSMICLLMAYPATRGSLPAVKRQKLARGRSKCTLVVDRTNAHMLLNKSHLKNLELLKGNKEILDICRKCEKTGDVSNEQWIECDVCNRWYHCSCVNAQLDEDFICTVS